ncbi:ParA family protein [bacterium]|nr:ParA family protein [bacterium]
MKNSGIVIFFTGSKGGSGQSFIANCIANYISIKSIYKVLMVDMNIGSRDSRIIYHVEDEEIMTITDLNNDCNIDVGALKKMIFNFENSLNYIFPPLKYQKNIFKYDFLQNLFEIFKSNFDVILVDCDMFVDFNIKDNSIFCFADEIILISLPDKISVYNLNSIISYFCHLREKIDIKIVINKYNIKPSIPFLFLNSTIRYPINHFIPYDRDIENLYLTKGPGSIFNYNLKIVKDLSLIAENIINMLVDGYGEI